MLTLDMCQSSLVSVDTTPGFDFSYRRLVSFHSHYGAEPDDSPEESLKPSWPPRRPAFWLAPVSVYSRPPGSLSSTTDILATAQT